MRLLLMIPELSVDIRNPITNETQLLSALKGPQSSLDCVKELVTRGADLAAQDLGGDTVLHLAAPHLDILRYLFSLPGMYEEGYQRKGGKGGDKERPVVTRRALMRSMKKRNKRGLLPMQLAIQSFECVDAMLQFWQRLRKLKEERKRNKRNITGKEEEKKGKGKEKEKESEKGKSEQDRHIEAWMRAVPYATLLHWAAGVKGGANSVRWLQGIIEQLKRGGKRGTLRGGQGVPASALMMWLNERDDMGRTPLHWAAAHNNPEKVELLLSEGASVNSRISNPSSQEDPLQGCFAAHLAAQCGYLEVLKILNQVPVRSLSLSLSLSLRSRIYL